MKAFDQTWNFFGAKGFATEETWPLTAMPVLTARERELHRRLIAAYPSYFIFTQVALSQLIGVRPHIGNADWIRRRYKQLVADFVLCRPDYSVVAVIELDDLSHLRADRQDADRRKSIAVRSAGLRLVRIPAGPIPGEAKLRQLLERDLDDVIVELGRTGWRQTDSAVTRNARGRGANLLIGVVAILAAMVVLGSLINQTAGPPRSSVTNSVRAQSTVAPPTIPSMSDANARVSRKDGRSRRLGPVESAPTPDDSPALQAQKEAAWANEYTPGALCESPETKAERIECGNRYLRARRDFELRWNSQQRANQ